MVRHDLERNCECPPLPRDAFALSLKSFPCWVGKSELFFLKGLSSDAYPKTHVSVDNAIMKFLESPQLER